MMLSLTLAALALLPDPDVAPAAPPPPAPVAAPQKADKPKIYCVDSVITGSRMPRRKCLTRAEWLHQDFDPLNPDKN